MIEDKSILESRIENGSENFEDYWSLGKIYLDRGDYDKILKLYERASTLPLSNAERGIMFHDRGLANDLLGKKEDAISCYEKSLDHLADEEDPFLLDVSAMSYYSLATLLYYEEKGAEYATKALERFEVILHKYPDYEEKSMVYAHIAELYSRFDEFAKAIENCENAITTAINDEERIGFLVTLGSIFRDKRDFGKSEAAYNQALASVKGKRSLSRINFELGRMYFDSERIEDAIEAFSSALEFMEFDPVFKNDRAYAMETFYALGLLHYYKNQYENAIGYLNKISEDIDENHIHYCNTQMTLGHCYLARGEYDIARDYYDKVVFSPLATNENISMANECLNRIEKNISGT